MLYREQLSPGVLAAADANAESHNGEDPPASLPDPDEAEGAPAESLLAKAEAYVNALAALHGAQQATAGKSPLVAALEQLQDCCRRWRRSRRGTPPSRRGCCCCKRKSTASAGTPGCGVDPA